MRWHHWSVPIDNPALQVEQQAVDVLYARLDELSARTEKDLERARRSPTAGTPAARVEREAMIAGYTERLGAFRAAESRLCFGRMDAADPARAGFETLRIGRLSLSDAAQRSLLTDWRATAAEPFYRATSASPMGIARRRHIMLEGRRVAAVEDDVLDMDAVTDDSDFEGGGALMAALAARRTGRMGDIVATIQAEQDRIIRAPLPGILVVEGGPGCGKTVVGLHRAAYLLYTHRDQIARSGVLVVGPNALFLRYISQVLPGLGESSAVLATPGQLFPGVDARPESEESVAVIKGDLRMVEVVAAAVRARQRIPEGARRLDVAGTVITLTPAMVSAARDRARASRKPHNRARLTFVLSLLDRLAVTLAAARGVDADSNRDILLADLRDSRDVRREVNLAWMPLTPQGLLADLFASPERLAEAAPRLSARERAALQRQRGAEWTQADVPLLDEAAELLGEDDEPARRAAAIAASERQVEAEYARGVLEMTGVREVTAEELIDSYAGGGRIRRTAAENAITDRTWTFGHVVVDEAQELSPMAWRLLMRRCPTRSMTVVGDLAQSSSAAGPTTWADVFDKLAVGRWSAQALTVNYRTPGPVMDLAAAMLRAAGDSVQPPRSAREGRPPQLRRVASPARLPNEVFTVVNAALAGEGVGRVGVIAPPPLVARITAALTDKLPHGRVGHGDQALDHAVAVLTPAQAKGLEFDVAVVVEPATIMEAGSRGTHDLYVALTRPTKELVVVHNRPLPAGMAAAADGR
jgi:DNA helicase IV